MLRTVDRFPYCYSHLGELPQPVADKVREANGDAGVIGIIHLPPQERSSTFIGRFGLRFLWHDTPTWTMVFGEQQLTLVSRDSDGQMVTYVIPHRDVVSIEIGTILLYAYVELQWLAADHIDRLKIEFNAIGERMIRMHLDQIRPWIAPPIEALEVEGLPLPDLALKFRNYLRMALLPGEKLREVVFQPAIFGRGRWIRTQLAQGRTIAVTDRHVLFVEDDPRPHNRYGVVTRYIPLGKVQNVSLDPMPEYSWLRMIVGNTHLTREQAIPLEAPAAAILSDAICRQLSMPYMRNIERFSPHPID